MPIPGGLGRLATDKASCGAAEAALQRSLMIVLLFSELFWQVRLIAIARLFAGFKLEPARLDKAERELAV